MNRTKFSRQREIIMQNLRARVDHPTADELYESVKKDVSLPTVYRNLSKLCEDGEVMRIATAGADRFDACTAMHTHFECESCGRVEDINIETPPLVGKVVQGHRITNSKLMTFGICPQCQNINYN